MDRKDRFLNNILPAILAASLAVFGLAGLSGCGPEKTEYGSGDTVAFAGNVKISYSALAAYKRIMQAETYTYLQAYATTDDIWSEELLDDEAEYGSYGEMFESDTLDDIKGLLLANLHSEDYGVSFTDDDREACEEIAEAFINKTDEEALDAMKADKGSVMEVLELLAVESHVKEQVYGSTDVEVAEEEYRQVPFSYVAVLADSYDAPKVTAKEILKKIDAGESLEDAIGDDGDMSAFDSDYTESDPEYDDFADGLLEFVEGLEDGENGIYSDSSGNAYVVCRGTGYDEEAGETKEYELYSQKLEAAYEALLDGWAEETPVDVDMDAWGTLEANSDAVYESLDEDEAEDTGNSLIAGSSGSQSSGTGVSVSSDGSGAVSVETE